MTKTCSKCGCVKHITEFHRMKNGVHGRSAECAGCANARRRNSYHQDPKHRHKVKQKYYQANRERILERQRRKRDTDRNAELQRLFGISQAAYNQMLTAQHHRCAICNIEASELAIKLAVDHDHNTGEIRGLLCHKCNIGLGYFGDNILTLTQAAEYLRSGYPELKTK